jgi:hypothetical protein
VITKEETIEKIGFGYDRERFQRFDRRSGMMLTVRGADGL